MEALREIAAQRGFTRIADVEMALWVLQVGVLDDELLPSHKRDSLKRSYQSDALLPQLQTRNLIKHLFSEKNKLDNAENLLTTDPELAGQIAGIEFEQLVGKHFGPIVRDESLKELIDRAGGSNASRLHKAREIRNRAIHHPRGLKPADVEYLIRTARCVRSLRRRSRPK